MLLIVYTMEVFLYEHATCSNEALPSDILLEGFGMFKTLYLGFKKFSNVSSFTFRDENPFNLPFAPNRNVKEAFIEFVENSEHVLVVAPEDDFLLYNLTLLIEELSSKNLCSPSKGILETSDKYQTYCKIKMFSPKTEVFNGKTKLNFPLVAKPRCSCSCDGIFIVKSENDLKNVPKGYIVQEYIDGIDMSASLIVGDEIKIISINRQIISKNFNFKLNGLIVPADVNLYKNIDLEPIFKSVEKFDLFGYVGVDFIISHDNVFVVEINPRITTSVIAFEDVYGYNISELIFKNYYKENFEIKNPKKTVKIAKKKNIKENCFVRVGKNCLVLDKFS